METVAIEAVKALAWPVAALSAALIFYRPICKFAEAIGARVTKLSIFKVELELLSIAKPSASPSLESIKKPEGAAVANSSQMLFQQVQDATPADYALIDIDDGSEWLSSRLFIGALMLEKMRGVEVLVFVGRHGATHRRLLAVSSLRQVRWALAVHQPWLEAAFALAYAEAQFGARAPHFLPIGSIRPDGGGQPRVRSLTGGLEPYIAGDLVRRFIELIQDTSSGINSTWVDLAHGRMERATWVTDELLNELLAPEAFDMWVFDGRDKPPAEHTKAVLRRKAPYVALVNPDRQFIGLVNRRTLLEAVATSINDFE